MFFCPICRKSLEYKTSVWECPDCRKQLIYFHQVEGISNPGHWHFQSNNVVPPEICPSCFNAFQHVSFHVESRPITAMSCPNCRLLWINSSEQIIPQNKPVQSPVAGTVLQTASTSEPLSASERLAVMQAKMIATQFKRENVPNRPEHWWEYILAFLGLPVHAKKTAMTFPWVTWSVIGLTCFISFVAWNLNFRQMVMTLGMVPARVKDSFGMTLITAFFLHGNLSHLLGNMYFLGLFGGKAEYNLGRSNFLLLLLSATLIGNFAHLLFDPHSVVPLIGASGGISGVIVFYCFKFPKDKFYQLFYFRFIKVSAWVYVVFWLILQMIGVGRQIAGYSNVSSLAHIGGALVGVLCAITWHDKTGIEEEDPLGLSQ